MTIIVNGVKAYINPSIVDTAGGKLTVNMHACEYGGVAYVTTDD